MIFAIIMVIAVSIPCVSAATSELVTTKKVSFTAEWANVHTAVSDLVTALLFASMTQYQYKTGLPL